MKTFRYFYLLVALAAFSACGDDDEPQVQTPEEVFTHVKIDASVGRNSLYTRSNPVGETEEDQTEFCNGDRLSVSDGNTTVVYTMGNDGWTPMGEGLKWENFPVTFQAYYPASENATIRSFTLPTDQEGQEKIALADYMTGTREISAMPGEGKLILKMMRQMSRVIVRVSGVDASLGGSLSSMKIYSQYATIPEGGNAVAIAPYVAGNVYATLVVPGKGNDNELFLQMTTANGTSKTVSGIKAAVAGKSYTYDVYVGVNSIELSEPIVSDWETGATLPGDLVEVVRPETGGYFVKPVACGDKSGKDWENAMGAEELRNLLKTTSDQTLSDARAEMLDGKTIYLAGGDYPFVTDDCAGVKMEYQQYVTGSGYNQAVAVRLEGGYNPNSTGVSTDDRNIEAHVTAITNTASLNSPVYLMALSNQIDLTCNGITFDGGYEMTADGYLRSFLVEHGSTGKATLALEDCVIKNFNTSASDNNDGQGVVLRLNAGIVKMNRVRMFDNVGPSRGIINLGCGDNGYLFMNNCLMTNNIVRTYWGIAIQSNGNACINNTTIYNNGSQNATDQCATINGSGNVLFVNSTIYHNKDVIRNERGIYRYESTGNIQFMNSVMVASDATVPAFKQESGQATSKGYNVYQNNSGFAVDGSDNPIDGIWNFTYNNGVCEWTAPSDMHFATKSEVSNVVKAYSTSNYPTLGQEFAIWLGDDLGKDQRGSLRNAGKMQPGAYDAGL